MNDEQDPVKPDVEPAPIWLVTFGDTTALMLTFFVMLFSMSQIQSEKWDALLEQFYLRDRNIPVEKAPSNADQSIATVDLRPALPTDYLDRIVREAVSRDPVLGQSTVTRLSDRVVISLPAADLFSDGSDTLTPLARESVFRLGVFLAQIGNQVEVLGHTDPLSPLRRGFVSTWSLSLARATSVARELARSGYGRTLEIMGLGDAQFRHLDAALSEAQRVRRANRVDIVIHQQAEAQ